MDSSLLVRQYLETHYGIEERHQPVSSRFLDKVFGFLMAFQRAAESKDDPAPEV